MQSSPQPTTTALTTRRHLPTTPAVNVNSTSPPKARWPSNCGLARSTGSSASDPSAPYPHPRPMGHSTLRRVRLRGRRYANSNSTNN
ncbi:hypothetical protein BDZ91DRAFT_722582 [Kalaharituber pfeilii]|nr:hypothetical protein BDZ91DRAFT_722582 [Kalaharituber pfeilii]